MLITFPGITIIFLGVLLIIAFFILYKARALFFAAPYH